MGSRVLVVDDSAMVRTQVARVLTGAGFAIVEACDGADALAKLSSAHDVRLVVCDVNMPHMSGLDFLERLRERGSAPPVVMLTTEGQADLIARAKGLGAKGWIVKPFKPELLIAAAQRLTAATSG